MVFEQKRELALVLSGGSARGMAHIGVLEVLEENHIPIDTIVGTSMGALIGGLYAAGTLKEFKKAILKLTENKILSLFLSTKIKKGNTSTKAIEPFLKRFTKNKRIDDLPIDFTAVATDLRTGKEVFIDEGSLLKSILSSISIPGIFQPVQYNHKLLIDGGVVDPLPQKYGQFKARKVIAVNALPTIFKYKKEADVFDVISEAVGIMTNELISLKLEEKEECLLIQLQTSKIDPFDFSKSSKLIQIGRDAATKNLRKITRLIAQ